MRVHALRDRLHSALLSVGLALSLAGGLTTGIRPANAATAIVPNLVGQPMSIAAAVLVSRGGTIGNLVGAASATVPIGNVISQSPAANSVVTYSGPTFTVDMVFSGGLQYPTPSVVGQTQAAATAAITVTGFTLGAVVTSFSATVPAGIVISQDPPGGTILDAGSAVSLTVSLGPGTPGPVPNVVGLSAAAAQQALAASNQTYGLAAQGPSPIGVAGEVYAQNPEAGTVVAAGARVDVWISTGLSAQGWVPTVVGQTQTSATAVITAAGLVVGTINTQFSANVAAGTVIAQSPASGATRAPGSAVDLVVSRCPAPLLELSLVPKVDFNGDYKGDVVIQSSYGSANVLLMNGTTFTALPDRYPVVSYLGGWRLAGVGDFNGDGKSDIVVANADGQLFVKLMDGYVATSSAQVLAAGTGWRLALIGDFDGDGRSDLLWKHTAGWVAMWLMNGTAVTADAPLLSSGSGWNVALVGDFNGDGKTDILLEKRSGGALAAAVLWLMDGVTVSQVALLSYVWNGWDLKP